MDLAHEPTQQAAALALGPGSAIGDYVIDRFLGAGAMGEVYAGHHPVIGKKVAIKLLKADLASSPEAAERFVREAKATNQIDHPNVIDIFNFGRTPDGRLFLVMDLVAGTSLRARVARGPLAIDSALAILDAIAAALDAAHARGVIHRDLKPDNVMLGADDQVYVLDFGIARLVSTAEGAKATGNGTLTGQGTWLGTPGYMAPEQWSSDGAGPASDRYALGVMAFELLAGKLPFTAPNLPAMMEQHFRAPVPALGTARGDAITTARGDEVATVTLDPVLARAMAKDPDARFATGREMVAALRLASGTGRGDAIAPASAPTRRALPWVPAAIGVGVLGAGVVAVLALRGGDTTTAPQGGVPDRDVPPPGTIALRVVTTPVGAEVFDGDRDLGPGPRTIYVAPDARVQLRAVQPGYEPATATTIARADAAPVALVLVQANGFEGVWRLPDGELRELRRAGERVDIFKRAAVTGPREPFRTYAIAAAAPGEAGFAFVGTETIVEHRGDELACNVASQVRYHYDPARDQLEVARERVGTKVEHGACVVVSRALGTPVALARADATGDVHYADAPVGMPPAPPQVPNDTLDNKLDANGPRRPGDDKGVPPAKPIAPLAKKSPPKLKSLPNPPDFGAAQTSNGAKAAPQPQAPLPQRLPAPQAGNQAPDLEPNAPVQQIQGKAKKE